MAKTKVKGKKNKEQRSNLPMIIAIVVVVIVVGVVFTIILSSNRVDYEGEYDVIKTMKSTHEPGKVHLTEFVDFTCPHCYTFHSVTYPKLKEKYGDRIDVTYHVFPLRQQNILMLELYEFAVDIGKGEEMMNALYIASLIDNRNVQDPKVLKEIAVSVGIDPKFVEPSYLNDLKGKKIQDNINLGRSYGLTSTPLIILDGNIHVTIHSYENLETIIDSILS